MNDTSADHRAGDRLAKVIARAGLGSRREAEAWIAAGRVAVNGEIVRTPARNVTGRDRIAVDGEPLPARERTRLFLYHKPRGLLTTQSDPQGRPTLFERLPEGLPRLVSVGRLDYNTEGLLLLTNDGALARVLELPATGWLRRYRVRAHGTVTQTELDGLRDGVTVSGIHYGAVEASLDRVQGSNLWLTFAIREGKNREVRNVLSHLGLSVTRLIRVSFGPFQLGEIAEGAIEEVRTRVLREQLGARVVAVSGADFSKPVAAPPARPVRGKTWKPVKHAWRARDLDPQKPLRQKFHGSRRDETQHEQPTEPARAGILTDRKGRRVPVVRHGPEKAESPPHEGKKGQPSRQRTRGRADKNPDAGPGGRSRRARHRSADRASGPRPSRPRQS